VTDHARDSRGAPTSLEPPPIAPRIDTWRGRPGRAHASALGLAGFGLLAISLTMIDIDREAMVRTVISLSRRDKEWLDRKAREDHVPMTRVVQVAVRRLREEQEATAPDFAEVLRRTSGLWPREEGGLAYQRRVRGEWNRER
jgi:hypothetical protein